jgi:hypothetical protein
LVSFINLKKQIKSKLFFNVKQNNGKIKTFLFKVFEEKKTNIKKLLNSFSNPLHTYTIKITELNQKINNSIDQLLTTTLTT